MGLLSMAKMTKAAAKRMCIAIEKKAFKLHRYGRENGLPPSFYTKALNISDGALKMLSQLK